MIISECGAPAPSGLALLAFGHPSGHKTNDESFAQNAQLSPVLMPPSHTLRDLSCFNGFKSQSPLGGDSKPFGHVSFTYGPRKGKGKSASLRSARKAQKMKGLKAKRRLSAFGKLSLNYGPSGQSHERA